MPELELGTRLYIKTDSSIEHHPELALVSVFEATLPDNYVLISAPFYKGSFYPLHPGETLYVHFVNKDGRYDFMCAVAERVRQGGLHFIKARLTSKIAHSQRRDHYRLQRTMKGTLSTEKADELIDGEGNVVSPVDALIEQTECLTFDISAGGVCLYARKSFAPQDVVTISLPINFENPLEAPPAGRFVDFVSEVMWCKPSERETFDFCVGLRFLFENNRERERMVQYVFDHQREMLQQKRLRGF